MPFMQAINESRIFVPTILSKKGEYHFCETQLPLVVQHDTQAPLSYLLGKKTIVTVILLSIGHIRYKDELLCKHYLVGPSI